MEFIELKLAEKIGKVLAYGVKERKYQRYELIQKWCSSDTYQLLLEFDVSLCSQAMTYILRVFEEEYKDKLPAIDDESPLYEDDLFWFGYLIAYWYFMDGTTGKDILQKYDICKVLDEFEILHTLSIRSAIDQIMEDDKL